MLKEFRGAPKDWQLQGMHFNKHRALRNKPNNNILLKLKTYY